MKMSLCINKTAVGFDVAVVFRQSLSDLFTAINTGGRTTMNDDYRLPVRMQKALAMELDAASIATGIDKSSLVRKGVSRLIIDLKNTGRSDLMSKFHEHYREIV